MDKFSVIPDNDFHKISKRVKELRNTIYANKEALKIDFITLLFARVDVLLESYANALNSELSEDKFNEIKIALKENCHLLDMALQINEIEHVKQIAYKEISRHELLSKIQMNDSLLFTLPRHY